MMKAETSGDKKVLTSIEALLSRRRFKQAGLVTAKHLLASPKDIGLLFCMFHSLFGQRNYNEAEVVARRITKLASGRENAYLNLGAALQKQGKIKRALDCYRLELRFNPESLGAHYNLGITLANRNQWRRSLPHLLTCFASEAFPCDGELEFLTARAAFKAGDQSAEAVVYKKILKACPNDSWALTNLSAVYMDLQDFKNAKTLLDKAQQLVPSDQIVMRLIEKCNKYLSNK